MQESEAGSDDGDLHPSDAAVTTPEFLAGLWQLIARGNHMVRGVSTTAFFMELFQPSCFTYY